MHLKNIIFLSVILLISCAKNEIKNTLQAKPIKVKNGFGYIISIDDSIIISQPNIPGISGEIAFKSAEDAQKVGNLVLKKIENHQSPSIIENDLKNLKINY